jgi:hypothetical protein
MRLPERQVLPQKAGLHDRLFALCAEHAQQLGGASPLSSLMVVKD